MTITEIDLHAEFRWAVIWDCGSTCMDLARFYFFSDAVRFVLACSGQIAEAGQDMSADEG